MLNRLHRLLPEGLLADAAWFTAAGYRSSLRSRYLASGWLQTVARGVFRRPPHRPGMEDTTAPLRSMGARQGGDFAGTGRFAG